MGVDQIMKALFSIPIWWLIFVLLVQKKLLYRLLLQPALIPGFCPQLSLSLLCHLWRGHLGSYGSIWDIYIPVLFYFIQFGIFHAIEYHQRQLEAQERNAALLRIQDQAELNALKAQLNPHFLIPSMPPFPANWNPSGR